MIFLGPKCPDPLGLSIIEREVGKFRFRGLGTGHFRSTMLSKKA